MNGSNVLIIDTGPLVALVDKNETHHSLCMESLRALPRSTRLATTAPILTEAFYLLSKVPGGQDKLFELLQVLNLSILEPGTESLPRIHDLMNCYKDLPMDFADAVTVATAEEKNIKSVMTLDWRDFQIYRPAHTKRLILIPSSPN